MLPLSSCVQISPHWNKLVLDHRKGLPPIASVIVDVEAGKADLRSMKVVDQYVEYFGFLRSPKHGDVAHNVEKVRTNIFDCSIFFYSGDRFTQCSEKCEQANFCKEIIQYLLTNRKS